jgi:hypothetical protein
MPLFIAFAFLFIIPGTAILISNNGRFGTTSLVYGQLDHLNSNVTNSLNIQNIPVKKIHVGDIDIAYKGTFSIRRQKTISRVYESNEKQVLLVNRGQPWRTFR